jgi:hypothetical protein
MPLAPGPAPAPDGARDVAQAVPPLGEERCVQESYERSDRAERSQQLRIETVRDREGGLARPDRQELFEAQVLHRRVIRGISLRYTDQLVTGERADSFPERAPRDHAVQRSVPSCDVLPNQAQVWRCRHIQSATDANPLGRDLQV